MSTAKERERVRKRERLRGGENKRKKKRGQGKRKGKEEERTNGRRKEGRERLRRRESSYYKWQSLPGAFVSIARHLNCCHNGMPPLGDYPSPLKDLFHWQQYCRV